MTIAHGLISSAILSGIVFAASTLPLGLFGAEPITLKIGDRPTFSGRFEELATPYLTFATLLSLGIGVTATSILGWQSSSQRLEQAEERLTALKQQLEEKEALLEHFKFSDQKLQSTGLSFFLESDAASSQSAPVVQKQTANGDDRHHTYFNSVNLHSQVNKQEADRVSGPLSPDLSTYNLKDETQVEALLDNLKQVMSQIEKLKAS